MAKCYIMASISDVLQNEHAEMESAKDIMSSLSQMFADKSQLAKQNTLRNIMNSRMAKGQSIREHMLKMMDNFNVAEILGANIDMHQKVDMILETLPVSYNQFKLNYNMNKLNMDLTELM